MKLTHTQALTVRAALLQLDGLDRAVEVNGKTAVVKKPFKLSGKTRLKTARNLRPLEAIYRDYEKAYNGLVKEWAGDLPKVPDEKMPKFNEQHALLLGEQCEVALTPLTLEELNLDDNAMPHTALAVFLEHLIETTPADPAAE